MACRWSTPSHYLNQSWDGAIWTFRNRTQWNFSRNSYIFIQENAFENVVWKMAANLSRSECVISHQKETTRTIFANELFFYINNFERHTVLHNRTRVFRAIAAPVRFTSAEVCTTTNPNRKSPTHKWPISILPRIRELCFFRVVQCDYYPSFVIVNVSIILLYIQIS